jgi:hypothetical protein
VDLGQRRKEIGEGAKMEKKAAAAAAVPKKRTPAPPGPTHPDLGFRGAQGERKGRDFTRPKPRQADPLRGESANPESSEGTTVDER